MRHMQAIATASEPSAGLADAPRDLLPGQPLRLDAARGWLTVVAGSVWLTRLDDLEDHWLSAGQSMHLTHARSVVVEAWDHRAARVVWHAEKATVTPAARRRRAGRETAAASLHAMATSLRATAASLGAAALHAAHAIAALAGRHGAHDGDNRPGQQQGQAHVGHGRSGGAGHGAWA